eukprot:scaffold115463_cov41-Phaeocystis_antarctica.AAC.2
MAELRLVGEGRSVGQAMPASAAARLSLGHARPRSTVGTRQPKQWHVMASRHGQRRSLTKRRTSAAPPPSPCAAASATTLIATTEPAAAVAAVAVAAASLAAASLATAAIATAAVTTATTATIATAAAAAAIERAAGTRRSRPSDAIADGRERFSGDATASECTWWWL